MPRRCTLPSGECAAFETLLEIPGESGMDVQVDVEVAELIPDLINRETCEVHGQVNIEAQVVEVIEREVVAEAVEVKTTKGRPPSYVCVRGQPEDTLWKIAARYGSTVELLLNYNPGLGDVEQEGFLPIGMRLFIPRQTQPQDSLEEAN